MTKVIVLGFIIMESISYITITLSKRQLMMEEVMESLLDLEV